MNASLSNVTVVGFGNTEIVHNSVDPKTFDFYTKLHLPRLRIDGNYDLLGRILVIPLKGRGTCWFDASKYKIFDFLCISSQQTDANLSNRSIT